MLVDGVFNGVIVNSVGVWERFKDKIYPRVRLPDFIFPLFSPLLGVGVDLSLEYLKIDLFSQIADKLRAGLTPPVATQGYGQLKQRYWWWPTQWAAARAKYAARNKQQDIATRGGVRKPAPPPRLLTPAHPPAKPKSVAKGAKSHQATKPPTTPKAAVSG